MYQPLHVKLFFRGKALKHRPLQQKENTYRGKAHARYPQYLSFGDNGYGPYSNRYLEQGYTSRQYFMLYAMLYRFFFK